MIAGAALVFALLTRGGDRGERAAPPSAPPPERTGPTPPPAPPREGLSIGLTETSAALLWSAAAQPAAPAGFASARHSLAALRPRYFRLMVDWSVLQPDPAQPPDWTKAADGCVRGHDPCAASAGVRDILRAVASQQQAGGGYDVLVSIFGVPPWAAREPFGCERPDTGSRSRPITDPGLEAYRALVRSIAALGAAEGVPLRWWSPWNEPNGPFFVSPQRLACDRGAPLRSPRVFARLARAMKSELDILPGDQHLVIAELAGLGEPQMRGGGVEEFYDALPDEVVCSAAVYAQHAYVERGRPEAAQAPVDQLKAALDRRPCAAGKPIWITETGVGGPDVGGPRTGGPAEWREDCRAMDAALRRWDADERVQAAFQYLFRDDPSYPVGLADVGLTRLWPAYDLWRAWGGERPPGGPPPELPAGCAAA
ncbi:MAG: hypothetical protein QOD55_2383 [Solirubrobacteraceae bacterium]|nr:hypothetical protein [Solirubrobacteraceae bacterium]